ncbi:CDP-glycerol glycerophosphotransferase family protein [Shouchella miscanthi]|uniref:CDP-glycerol glycerophosphotransferase family protein n=1 Tax=Shouchella miscanthi TaxID=2598861 RepID=UPI0011A4D89F|nr:CDP-glycerol glycerophosphotransferase family protein [Shouchella miscanthi]
MEQKQKDEDIKLKLKKQYPAHVSLKKLSLKNGNLTIEIVVGLLSQQFFTVNEVLLKLRSEASELIHLNVIKKEYRSRNRLKIRAEINLRNIKLQQFFWDFFVSISVDNITREVRVVCDNYLIMKSLKHRVFKNTLKLPDNYISYPYITYNGGVSLTYRQKGHYETTKNKFKEYMAFIIYQLFYRFIGKKVWLIHEKFSETAQDNSFYFFKYCYEKHPEKKVYYVIKKESADVRNLEPFKDRVVHFMSFKHLVYLLSAKVIISSEAKGHGYAWRVSQGIIKEKLNNKSYIFLQHGVLGLKKVDSTFNYQTANSARLFIVSSDFEKKIVKNYFGYPESRISVTGLARWDNLKDTSLSNKEGKSKEIVLMPTWRNWLEEVEETTFLKSNYYISYSQFLNSKELGDLLVQNSLTLNFYVHPKFMPYVEKFSSASKNINIIRFGDESLNHLLMRASLLITDYSSVAWEMYYQKKPVIFYLFDLDEYKAKQGAYMNLKKDLFGDLAFKPEELLQQIDTYAKNGFNEKKHFASKRNKYFKYMDQENSKRIYEDIQRNESTFNKKSPVLSQIKNSDALKVAWRKYKYYPSIRKLGEKILGEEKK